MQVTILGLRWRVSFEPLGRVRADGHYVDGITDNAKTKGRTIYIDSRLSGERELETILHEYEHACDQCASPAVPFVHSEEYVTQKAKDLARYLWRLGYRRNADSQESEVR